MNLRIFENVYLRTYIRAYICRSLINDWIWWTLRVWS